MSIFTSDELIQMKKTGVIPENVERQFSFFQTGFPFSCLKRPAMVGDGILRKNEEAVAAGVSSYDHNKQSEKIVKFVPASGAASRMFKPLFDIIENDDPRYAEKGMDFIHELELYPFYRDLSQVLTKNNLAIEELIAKGDYKTIIRALLFDDGLNYSAKPKALLKFFDYDSETRYAVEEHLVEAALYASCLDNRCFVHFTLSPQHLKPFEEVVSEVKGKYEERFKVKYDISYSVQDPATDTLAATEDNRPFRDEQGNLLFRPGGHGALIGNLNALDADIVFVKNIDNVTDESHVGDTVAYKKLLASILKMVRDEIFTSLSEISDENFPKVELRVRSFFREQLNMEIPMGRSKEQLINFLNRPIRICGMVKNEGEPGGGPFWVRAEEGGVALQIVESSQIDKSNPQQKTIWEQSTHFNPVDMVCSIKNYKGEKFDLKDFVDEKSGFISEKSYNGKLLKAMELPGLWNGAMANWLTIFVEVPLSTFNPVKTVYDLKAEAF